MIKNIPTRFPPTVPTVPTAPQAVGTAQLIDNKGCPDRSSRPDHLRERRGEKKSSLGGLVERLRQQEGGSSRFESRHEPTNPNPHINSPPPILPDVGTVGAAKENNALALDGGSGQGSGQPPDSRDSPLSTDDPPPPSFDDHLQMTEADWQAAHDLPMERQAAVPGPEPLAANGPEPVDSWAAGIIRLQRMSAPAGFTIDAWQLVRLGCATLLRMHGDELRRLGWSAGDAFGIHPTAPGPAIHCYGLGPLLRDGRVVAITESGATIELPGGIRHSFTRRPAPEAVPVWTL